MHINRYWLDVPIPLAMFVIGVWIVVTSRQIGNDMEKMRRKLPVQIGGDGSFGYAFMMAAFGVFFGLIGLAVLAKAVMVIVHGSP